MPVLPVLFVLIVTGETKFCYFARRRSRWWYECLHLRPRSNDSLQRRENIRYNWQR